MSLPAGMRIPGSKARGRAADAALVEGFLRANPAWLAEHPELYRVLEPPVRVHGDGVTDHMAAMLQVQRERADSAVMAAAAGARPPASRPGCRMRCWRCSAPRSGRLREP